MGNFDQDSLLHHKTKHSNFETPGSRYVTNDTFPAQNTELLNTLVTIKYREEDKPIPKHQDPATHRPADDTSAHPYDGDYHRPPDDIEIEDGEESTVYAVGEFRIVRIDAEVPHRIVLLSRDYSMIASGYFDPESEELFDKVFVIPAVDSPYLMRYVKDVDNVHQTDSYLMGGVVRVDDNNPAYTVIIELLENDEVRFVLGDERISFLVDSEEENGHTIEEFIRILLEGKRIYGTE